ncbi:hypothetical protein [Roseibium sp.]|uniref:hypothetical protein n=1 Tax=Roseibium sp. TaxID=1936156 RepID=UPI003B514CF4
MTHFLNANLAIENTKAVREMVDAIMSDLRVRQLILAADLIELCFGETLTYQRIPDNH